MCIPMAAASLALTAIGTAVSAYGAMQQGKAAEGQYKYQAAVARNNKIIADQNAQASLDRGKVEVEEHHRRVASLKGSQRAGFGASGVVVDSGSPLDIIADTAMLGELDAQTIKHNAEMEARNYRLQGDGFSAEAGLLKSRAGSARQSGLFEAGGTLLSGGSQFADRWSTYKRKGAI